MTKSINGRRAALALALAICLSAGVAAAAEWRPDEMITTKASIALYNIAGVDPAGISIDSKEGDVTLVGAVPSAEAKSRVVAAVREIDGVKAVRDELQVSTAPAPAQKPGEPTEIRGQVMKELAGDKELRDNKISVDAQSGGVVVLGGYANSLDQQLRALRIAHGVAGVQTVRNEMKSPPDTVHDLNLPEGSVHGADTRNRRERQALDGRAAEEIPGQAGDAPSQDPAEINPEGDTTHQPHIKD